MRRQKLSKAQLLWLAGVAVLVVAAVIAIVIDTRSVPYQEKLNHAPHRPNANTSISMYATVDSSCFNESDISACAVAFIAHDMELRGNIDTRWGFGTDKPITNVAEAGEFTANLLRRAGMSLNNNSQIGLTIDQREIVQVKIIGDDNTVASELLYP